MRQEWQLVAEVPPSFCGREASVPPQKALCGGIPGAVFGDVGAVLEPLCGGVPSGVCPKLGVFILQLKGIFLPRIRDLTITGCSLPANLARWMAGRRERRKHPVQDGSERQAGSRAAGLQQTASGGRRFRLSEACPNSSGQGRTACGAHHLLWWPQRSSQHRTLGVQVGQDPSDASPADRRQEGRTARIPHFG